MKTVLLVSPSLYLRELGAQALLRSGHRLVFADSRSDHPFHQLAHAVITCDLMDKDAAAETILAQLAAKGLRLDAVLTFAEWYVELTATVARRLGLRGVRPEVASTCRDKYRMKERLRERCVPVVGSRLAATAEEARAAAAMLGYPLVIKPLNYGGSDGVRRIDDERELAAAVAGLQRDFASPRPLFAAPVFERRTFVLEQYIDGREFSVETLSTEREHHVVQITEKLLGPEPDFFELGHIAPAPLSGQDRRAIERYAKDILEALDVRNTISHLELRLAPDPSFIEIGARPGGDKIIDLALYSRGIDMYGAWLASLLGEAPDLSAHREGVALVQFIFTEHRDAATFPSELAINRLIETTPHLAAYSYHNQAMASVEKAKRGDNRCGFVVLAGECREALVDAVNRLAESLAPYRLSLSAHSGVLVP